MSASKMNCSQCGAALPAGAARCPYCGSAVPSAPAEAPSEEKQPQMPPQFARLKRPKVRSIRPPGCSLFAAFLSVLLMLSGPLFFSVMMDEYQRALGDYNRLAKEGRPATARVTRLEIKPGESETYYVYYEFVAAVQGRATRFQGADDVSLKYFRTLSVGQEIPIIYWASDPSLSAVRAEFGPPIPFLPLAIGGFSGLLALVGLGLLFSSIRDIGRFNRLRAHGRLAQAFIFDRWTGVDSDGDPTYFVAYAFEATLPDGRKITVTNAIQGQDFYNRYQVGDAVPVRYLPDHPQICRLEPGE